MQKLRVRTKASEKKHVVVRKQAAAIQDALTQLAASTKGPPTAREWILRPIRSLIRWIGWLFTKAIIWLAKQAIAIVKAIKEFWDKYGDIIKAIFNAILEVLKWIAELLLKLLKMIWNLIMKIFEALMNLLPKFQYLTFENIYIRCLVDPKYCDPAAAKMLKMTMCFKSALIGFCLGPVPIPNMAQIGKWFADQMIEPIKNFFTNKFPKKK